MGSTQTARADVSAIKAEIPRLIPMTSGSYPERLAVNASPSPAALPAKSPCLRLREWSSPRPVGRCIRHRLPEMRNWRVVETRELPALRRSITSPKLIRSCRLLSLPFDLHRIEAYSSHGD